MSGGQLIVLFDALVSMFLVVMCVRRLRFLRNKDVVWKLAESRAIARGLKPERTSAWERRIDRQRIFLIVVSVVLGLGSIFLLLSSL